MNHHLDPEALFESLREDGLLAESESDRLTLTPEFTRTRERFRETVADLDTEARSSEAETFADGDDVEADHIDDELLADAMAVQETCENIDRQTSVYVARAIQRSESARAEPIPEGFLSITADEIDPFIERHPASVLYFWRDDCEPCESVKADLEALVRGGEIPSDVGLGAVYGPDFVATLRENYDVGAAPTVLFCGREGVESRFVGDPGRSALSGELSVLLDEAGLADGSARE